MTGYNDFYVQVVTIEYIIRKVKYMRFYRCLVKYVSINNSGY